LPDKTSQLTISRDNSREKDQQIEKLEIELSKKDKEIKKLEKEIYTCKGRLDEIRDEKKALMDELREFELMTIDLDLINAQNLQDENNRLAHRIQITKDQLDHAREHIKIRDQIISDMGQRKLLDYLLKRLPPTFQKYQVEENEVYKNQFQK
jgi:chromosome segregation ATPase